MKTSEIRKAIDSQWPTEARFLLEKALNEIDDKNERIFKLKLNIIGIKLFIQQPLIKILLPGYRKKRKALIEKVDRLLDIR